MVTLIGEHMCNLARFGSAEARRLNDFIGDEDNGLFVVTPKWRAHVQ